MIHIPSLILGTAIGTGIGMLIAPEKGSDTRSKLKKEGADIKDQFVSDFKEVREDLSMAAKSGKEKFKEEEQDFKVKASVHVEKVIPFLEKQLASLKKKNNTWQTS